MEKKDRKLRILYWLPWTQQFISKVCASGPSCQYSTWCTWRSTRCKLCSRIGLVTGPLGSSSGFRDLPTSMLYTGSACQQLQKRLSPQYCLQNSMIPFVGHVDASEMEIEPCFPKSMESNPIPVAFFISHQQRRIFMSATDSNLLSSWPWMIHYF